MGTIIKRNARVEKIEEDVRMAYKVALARGGAVAAAASEQLTGAVEAIDRAVAQRTAAQDAEEAARVTLMAEAERADRLIGSIRDAMWNELGRPRHSLVLDYVFPDGVATYSNPNPHDRPASMEVLHARLLSATAPVLTAEQRAGWAAQVDALRVTLDAAVAVHHPLAVKAEIAVSTYRSVVRAGLACLHAFKRALQIMGLAEPQIHDIIPDSPPTARGSSATTKPTAHLPSQPPSQPGGGTPANPPTSGEGGATPPAPSLLKAS